MKHPILCGAMCLAAVVLPAPALAEPPDLDIADVVGGEAELEVNAWRGDHTWLVRPELSVGLTDGLALQLQTDFGREQHEPAQVRDLSVQFTVARAKGVPLGLAAEAGVDPGRGRLRGELFLFGSREAGPWRADADVGLEQEGRETGFLYAWRVQRAVGPHWSAAVEGGGGGGFHGEHEHFAGVTVGAVLRKPAIELRFGWLLNLAGGDNLARIGFALPL